MKWVSVALLRLSVFLDAVYYQALQSNRNRNRNC